MELAEVEVRDAACCARRCARATADAGLKLGKFGDNITTLAQVVIIHIYYARATYTISEVIVSHSQHH
jgi:hypothetical protein